jgi:hypothetical protein
MTDEQANIDEQPTTVRSREASVTPAAAPAPAEPAFERDDGWLDDREELPPRPRRRLLTPLPLALLAALAIACGFIAGVLVEKGQGGSSSSGAAAGLASRFAAAGRVGSGSTSGSGSGGAQARGAASGANGAGGGASGAATVGQVAYVSKGALYVTTLEGNTVKVTAAPGATVTKSVKTTAAAIHPGETVVVTGSAGANGAIAAQSIRAGAAGTGGLTGGAGLFGGAGARTSGAGAGEGAASGSTSSGSGGEQALFGKG